MNQRCAKIKRSQVPLLNGLPGFGLEQLSKVASQWSFPGVPALRHEPRFSPALMLGFHQTARFVPASPRDQHGTARSLRH